MYSVGLVVALLTLSSFTDEPGNAINKINGHEYVDLGLPSGVKWAICNVGAKNPWEYGGYYAWGEIEEKSNYSWSNYKWCNGTPDVMTKYCLKSTYGTVDNKKNLDPEDDVARVKWGGTWRMPTLTEQKELLTTCTWVWTTLNGVKGYKVTGPNGNSIFLPAAGYRDRTEVKYRGSSSGFWSTRLGVLNLSSCLGINSSSYELDFCCRFLGYSVRPVSE